MSETPAKALTLSLSKRASSRSPLRAVAWHAMLEQMNGPHRHPVTAVLGPTNTGKTHLAVERMAAHSSGMIGFPLRLLAREV
jgi:RecA/RadA recombinase